MNAEKVQEAINNIVDPNRLNRQYPASKAQLAELEALGLIEFMPICKHPSVKAIGHTDAKKVLEAAKDSGGQVGGFNANLEGDVASSDASELYKALHEEAETVPTKDEPELVEIDGSPSMNLSGGKAAYSAGTQGFVWFENEAWSCCVAGIGEDGNAFESDDYEGFATKQAAIDWLHEYIASY